MNNLTESIIQKIEKGETMSPFLFLSGNMEVLHMDVSRIAYELLQRFDIDKNSLFHLPDTGESLKIQEIREFLAKGNEKPRFLFQIFLIENVSRMTLQSANAALKFLEEPGYGNIIFLTNVSQADVLDTILSRVQIVRSQKSLNRQKRSDYVDMVDAYFHNGDIDLITFLYTQKLEKQDYKDMLYCIFVTLGEMGTNSQLLSELEKDMQGLEKNNLSGKYVIDKYLTSKV